MFVIGNYIINVLILYYLVYFINLMFGGWREKKQINITLNVLRKKPIKTLNEQKDFLKMKYGDGRRSKLTWKQWLNGIAIVIFYFEGFYILNYIYTFYDIQISTFYSILTILIVPPLISYVLSKFKLDNNNSLIDILSK